MIERCFIIPLAVQCADVLVPEATEQALRYYHSGNLLWMAQQVWSLIAPLLLLVTGLSGKLGAFSEKWGRKWFFGLVIYLSVFIPLLNFLGLPLDFYAEYIRQHEYGLSTQTLGRWWDHYLKGIVVVVIGAISFIWIFYLLLKKSSHRWWLYSAMVSVGISFVLSFVQPIWISPVFNHFGPMKDRALETKILHLAERAGIEDARVFEVDKSQDTKSMNAYVTGFGATSRIVLWDTSIKGLSEEQLLFVMGHEMGHYVLHHVWWQLLYISLFSFLIFYLTYRAACYLIYFYYDRFEFKRLDQIASLPLFLFLLSFFSFLSIPLSNGISRYMEHEADRFGLEITQNNQAAAEAFVVLQKENLGNPRPGMVYRIWRSSHPPLQERVDFCNSYCPWDEGTPLKYGKFFTKS